MTSDKKQLEKTLENQLAVVIVHGKSESQMCAFVISSLRLGARVKIYRDKNSSIEITSVLKQLRNTKFRSRDDLIKAFFKNRDIKQLPDNFKIFIILDVDNHKAKKEAFMNKSMFKDHWAYDYIVPICNDPDLERVLERSGIIVEKKKDYIKIFPTDKKHIKSDTIQVKELSQKLKKNSTTNLDKFLDFCLKLSKENMIKI